MEHHLEHSKPTHHPSFYDDGGDIIVQAERTLFKVERASLASCSDFFAGMFASCREGEQVNELEGTSDEKPYLLRDCPASQFAHFLAWRNPGARPSDWDTTTFDHHAAVFAVGRRFIVDNAVKDAGGALNRMADNMMDETKKNRFLEARMYALGVEFDVLEWRNVALRRLLRRSARWYTVEEIAFLGLPTFLGIMRARESQIAHRLRFARTPIPLCHTFACRNNSACQSAFAGVWRDRIALDVTHPSVADSWASVTMSDMVEVLEDLDGKGILLQAGMSVGCWKVTLNYYGARHLAFQAEEAIFNALLEHLQSVPSLMTNWYNST
ncbi:hypothetical protein EV122DRAFT_292413 [Schizophyllum commune]